ncbi:MAG: F0F1 ATP synthase subunit delta [Peptococcaceae bacterium]|jgi:F-type H+-transporting ATPase subunit delta|nr:F0F1 ATP synthase subunit delta [Peptococcaceae bacterium]
MLTGVLARRYAQALFELAMEMSVLDQIESELRFLDNLILEHKDLKYILSHPGIEVSSKKEILAKILDNNVSEISKHFLYLLIDRRRQNILTMVLREFTRLANNVRNLVEAKVVSAISLSPEQEEKFKQVISKLTGKNVQLITEINPQLIGGAKIQIGDQVIDGTITAALSKLRQELIKASYKPQQEVGVS